MDGRMVREQQSRALVLDVLVATALVLSCGFLLGPLASLRAATISSFTGPKAERSCPDCRARAEQLRRMAGGLAGKATYQDLNKAVDLFEQSARLFQQDHSFTDAAENYIKIGEIYRISGRYRQELSMYDQALKLAGESEIALRCSIRSHQALAYIDTDIGQSRNFSQEAFRLSELTPDPSAKAEALVVSAELQMSADLEEAFGKLRSAVQLFHQAKDIDGEARAQLFAGYALFHLKSSFEDASSAFNEALRLWTSVNNAHGMAEAHRALGQYWYGTDEPQKAKNEYDLAEPVFHAVRDRKYEAIISSARGDVSAEVGNYEEALRYHQKAYQEFLEIGDVRGEMAAMEGKAHAQWVLHRYEKSRQLNKTKLRRARQLPGFSRYEASALGGIADFYVLHSDFAHAEPLYRQALDLFRTVGEPVQAANILIRLGRLYSKQAQDEQALSAFREALDIAEKKDQFEQAAAAHFEIAAIDQRRSRPEDARDEIESALKIIESQRAKIHDFDDRASYFASVHENYQFYIDILMQLDRQNPGQGFARKALEASEKSKVRSLLDMLDFASSALPLNEIQAEIRGDNVVILEYALGKENSYLWVIDEDRVTPYVLSSSTAQLSQLQDRFQKSLMANGIHGPETPHQEQARKKLAARYLRDQRELANALLGQARGSLHEKRVIIVPDGFLQYVPFDVLLPSGTNDLVMLPSASTLKALRDKVQGRARPISEVTVFADPVFEKDDHRVAGNSFSPAKDIKPEAVKQVARDVLGSSYIPRLPNSHYEAEAIVKAFGPQKVRRREGFAANRQTAQEDLSGYRVIHFATHGFLDTHHPQLSGLALSMVTRNGKAQDGYLRLRDIYQMKLSADLVVLSACQSALGKDLESEGMIGLTRAFFSAGSNRIISTLWRVDDQATAELMSHFYRRLHNGESPSVALRDAQSDLRRIPDWNHPYYWAAFVLQGEYRWSNESK